MAQKTFEKFAVRKFGEEKIFWKVKKVFCCRDAGFDIKALKVHAVKHKLFRPRHYLPLKVPNAEFNFDVCVQMSRTDCHRLYWVRIG